MLNNTKLKEIQSRYSKYAAWIVLLPLSLIFIFQTNEIFLFAGGDNAYYVLLAKSIATGQGYRDIFTPGAPPHTQYPPMFPLLLAIVYALRGIDMYFFKMVVSISAAISLILLYIFQRRNSFAMPIFAVIWLGCSARFFYHANQILSEITYMAFSMAALIFAESWIDKRKSKDFFPMLLFCWAAILTRTAGMTLAAAVGAALFFRLDKSIKSAAKSILVSAACLLPMIIWVVRGAMSGVERQGYFAQLLAVDPYDPTKGREGLFGFLNRIIGNAYAYAMDSVGLLTPNVGILPTLLVEILAILLLICFWGGMIHRLRNKFGVCEIYIIFYMFQIYSWSFFGYRFMMPIYPLILAVSVEGAYRIYEFLSIKRPGSKRPLMIIYIILFIAIILPNINYSITSTQTMNEALDRNKILVQNKYCLMASDDEYVNLIKACIWISENTPKDAIIMARKPTLVALASDRRIEGIPLVLREDIRGWLKKKGIEYIVVDEAYSQAARFVNAIDTESKFIEGLIKVHQSGGTVVLYFSPEFFANSQ